MDVYEIEPGNEKVEDELVLEETEIVEEKELADYEIIQELNEKEILTVSETELVDEKLEEPV